MALKLTDKEKKDIFWKLLTVYPEHENSRRQIKLFEYSSEEKRKFIEIINTQEKESYNLIKKFAEETGEDKGLLEYLPVNIEDYIK